MAAVRWREKEKENNQLVTAATPFNQQEQSIREAEQRLAYSKQCDVVLS